MITSNTYTIAEKQLINTLVWLRSRYALFIGFTLDTKASKETIEAFGKVWIGRFKEDWTNAFESLFEKGIIEYSNEAYAFTELGNTIKSEVDSDTPFYKYEYDNYFHLVKQSHAHSRFCEEVYGTDLSQHGMIDDGELSYLLTMLQEKSPKAIADIGCGNGRLTEWIAQQTGISFIGIDISSEAICEAKERTLGNALLKFEEGNLNQLHLTNKCDSIIFLDTLYYSNNIKETISQALNFLNEGGALYAYFSQWIMDEAYSENLKPQNTHLGKVYNDLNLEYHTIDLSASGKFHWKKKLQVLEKLKEDFEKEGRLDLWDYRYREAYRYANWGDTKYARYLYVVRK